MALTLNEIATRHLVAPHADHFSRYLTGDITVLHHALSGETHVLNFLAAAMLDAVIQGKSELTELLQTVRSGLMLQPSECPDDLMQSTMLSLCEAGLVSALVRDS